MIVFLIIPLGLAIFLTTYHEQVTPHSIPAPGASATAPATFTPELEIRSWRCEHESGYIMVRGEVKNISDRKLDNVFAVGLFRTAGGELVKSEDALLDFNPIMPGQTSPFTVGGTTNPLIANCGLDFKNVRGSRIASIDRQKNVK